MDVVAPLKANKQPAETVKPGKGSLNNPAVFSQMRGVFNAASGNTWDNASLPTGNPAFGKVIAFVGMEFMGAVRGTPMPISQGRNDVQQSLKHIRIMDVGRC